MSKSVFLASLLLLAHPAAAGAQGQCLSDAEARTEVQSNKLVSIQHAISAAREKAKGELISAHLCRLPAGFVYRISILERDGRVSRLLVNATNGRFSN